MTVCAKKRKDLAMLAIGALEDVEAESLRTHVAACPGCREYLREIEQVAAGVHAAEAPEQTDAPLILRRRARQAIHRERPRAPVFWRLALPAAASIIFVLVVMPRMRPATPETTPQSPINVNTIDSSVLTYQTAANESMERLDKILTEQGSRELPPTPVYRADSLTAENLSD